MSNDGDSCAVSLSSRSKQEEYLSLQTLQQQILDLQQALEMAKQLEEKTLAERSSLLHQLELFTDQIQQLQKKTEALDAENRRLLQEIYSGKQSNAMLNERLAILLKRATAATDSNKVLTSRLGSLERERDTLRGLLDLERHKVQEVMKVAEATKMEAVQKEMELKR